MIANEVMDETVTRQVQEGDITPIVKIRTRKMNGIDADAITVIVIMIDLAGMMIGTGRGIEIGVTDITTAEIGRDHTVGHPKLRGIGTQWQDQIDRENVNESEMDGIDGLHRPVDASAPSSRLGCILYPGCWSVCLRDNPCISVL